MKKIGRILKIIGKGAAKALPFVNIAGEVRDLNVRSLAKSVRAAATESTGDDSLKNRLYNIADLLDDGKANESMDERMFEKGLEIFFSLATSGALIYAMLTEWGVF